MMRISIFLFCKLFKFEVLCIGTLDSWMIQRWSIGFAKEYPCWILKLFFAVAYTGMDCQVSDIQRNKFLNFSPFSLNVSQFFQDDKRESIKKDTANAFLISSEFTSSKALEKSSIWNKFQFH